LRRPTTGRCAFRATRLAGRLGVADLPHVAAVRRAVEVLAGGGMVVVIDDADRENEGDLP
jgi:hypothetical protein